MIKRLPRLIAQIPTTVHTKLFFAFLTLGMLLVLIGLVGLEALTKVNRQTEHMVQLQRKIAAYRQLQYDTTAQLYNVTQALLVPDEQSLAKTLRQLNQFGYDLDRLQFVAQDEVKVLSEVETEYDNFIKIVTKVIELIRSGRAAEGRELQLKQASPLADRLQRLTNELVNRAAADIITSTDKSEEAYVISRKIVISIAVGSIGLALILGYIFSWSLIGPVQEMNARLTEIAAGDFSQHVDVSNRDELGTLANNLNRMNDQLGRLYQQLDAANRQKSRFLANVNHELRTPVSAIIGYASLLLRQTDGQLSPTQTENLQDLHNNAKRQLNMIDALLDFAKIEAGKLDIRVEPVVVEEVIRSATNMVEPMLDKNCVGLVQDIPTNLSQLHTDREKLRQILLNLLSNAVKFTDRGEIRISAYRENSHVKFIVADTGIGIESEDLTRIFDEFDRGSLANNGRYRGTGLGLAIVKRLVDLLGGSISVESEAGKGSTFTVLLPDRWSDVTLV